MSLREKRVRSVDLEAARFEIEILERELLSLKGAKREEVLEAYRKLLRRSNYQSVYLTRNYE